MQSSKQHKKAHHLEVKSSFIIQLFSPKRVASPLIVIVSVLSGVTQLHEAGNRTCQVPLEC